jgi:N-acetylmuramidase
MRAGASVQELKDWAKANGADPLVDTVWARIAVVESEGAEARLARERAEARAAAEKSRRLIRERGLRDPVRERRRYLMMVGSIATIAILSIGAVMYFTDAQERDRFLRDEVTTTEQARAFLADRTWRHWHPITGAARQKFDRLDGDLWLTARTDGSIKALEAYIADAQHTPQGNFLKAAGNMLASAERVLPVQTLLKRMRFYNGPVSGANDRATQDALALFRYRWNMPVSTKIDDALSHTLDNALEWWTQPRLEELRTNSLGAPAEADYVRFAEILGIDAATIRAVMEVETGTGSGFLPDGRMKILLERRIFSHLTGGRYDGAHPDVSSPSPGGYGAAGGAQYDRLAEAFALDPDAALQATSWGRLQIMGMQYNSLGYDNVGEFVRFMSQSEANQLEAGFIGFIRTWGLDKPLQTHDWAGFARRYNGPNYAANGYDKRLSAAYQRISAEIAAQTLPGQANGELAIPSASASLPTGATTPENRPE